ncbi:RNA polymerase sigma factor sigD, chloroplastic isoform X2 [Sesamum indicum]|uniref:RNA polymerase sigma factor sigD, chloroplastic isoform X2 n=1 Tax=Sesamum indicum TaxID=4182 RepID=A0A8M8UQN1_SESIN|nr:RNA polymerase sigma factor sigD, chloroplastic isoform X2 [Sesamum indicum]
MYMAMAICSCSKQSPALPNISFPYYSTKSFLKVSSYNTLPTYTQSPCNHTCSYTVQEDAIIIHSACTQHLAVAAAAAAPAHDMEKLLDLKGSENDAKRGRFWCNEVAVRRKRRRKLRTSERVKNDEDGKLVFVDKKEGKSRFMTSKEEARFSWYLKERARIVAVKTELLAETGRREVSSSQWAKAAGISQRNLDRILCNGRESEERITSCYRRLVVSIASSYQGKGLSLQDLTQEGSIGLLRGAIKFNPERGYKLSTYAYWWIRQSITRAIANKSKIIRLPGSISELVPKICEANAALSRRLRRPPTYDEIAEAIDANSSAVRLAIERNRSPISLDEAITSQGCMSLQDIVAGPDEITPEAMVKKDQLKPEIQKLLKPLCDREAHILRLHYGLNGETPWSFEEIGRVLELSRERVRQINSAALLKIRQTSKVEDLKHFI